MILKDIIGAYMIQSICKPERIYVGASVHIYQRWREHIWELKRGNHYAPKLQNHYNKYGIDDLIFIVLYECPKTDVLFVEQYFYDTLKPYFNTKQSYYLCPPVAQSEASNKKRSETLKGRIPWNKGMSGNYPLEPWNKGKKGCYSEETILRMKENRKNQVFSKESIKKRADALRGRKRSSDITKNPKEQS